MAIFSNFEGTLKDSITIGKGANKFTMSTDSASNTISFAGPSGQAQLVVGTPNNNNEVANKEYIDGKFVLTGPVASADEGKAPSYEIIKNYFQALDGRNQTGGYPGLDANGKIDPTQLPGVNLGDAYIAKNFQDMEVQNDTEIQNAIDADAGDGIVDVATAQSAGHGIQVGDILTINSIEVWRSNMSVTAGKIYRSIGWDNPDNQDNNDFWLCTTTHTTGAEFPFEADGTAKVGLETEAGYWSNSSPDNAAGTGPTYTKGDEFLWLNTIYVALNDNQNDPSNNPNSDWVEDGPDAGTYIVTQIADPTFSENFRPLSGGVNVTAFNGRVGTVYPTAGDYTANLITLLTDITEFGMSVGDTLEDTLATIANSVITKDTGGVLASTAIVTLTGGDETAPIINLSGSTNSGIYESATSGIAIAKNGVLKFEVDTDVNVHTSLDMNSNQITALADPTAVDHAATKRYVDAKPTIINGNSAPASATGKNDDLFINFSSGGDIVMPFSAEWTDIATDGSRWIALSDNTTGDKAAYSDDEGRTWTTLTMPDMTYNPSRIVSNGPGNFLVLPFIATSDAVASAAAPLYTNDGGETWNTVTLPGVTDYRRPAAVIPDSGQDYVIMFNESAETFRSSTGASWTVGGTLPAADCYWHHGIQVGNKILVTVDGEKDSGTNGTGSAIRSQNYAISTDGGASWTGYQFPEALWTGAPITEDGMTYYVPFHSGGSEDEVWRSTDGGLNFTRFDIGPLESWRNGIAVNNKLLFMGESITQIRRTTNASAVTGASSFANTAITTATYLRGATNGNTVILLQSNATTDTPIMRTFDFTTYDKTAASVITNLHLKRNDEWMGFEFVTSDFVRANFVSKSGDTMTGDLQVQGDVDANVLKAGSAELLSTLTNQDTAFLKIGNSDAVQANSSHVDNWSLVTTDYGTDAGNRLAFNANSQLDGVTKVLELHKDAVHANGKLQLNLFEAEGQTIDALAFGVKSTGTGYAAGFQSDDRGVVIASSKDDTTYLLEIHAGVTEVTANSNSEFVPVQPAQPAILENKATFDTAQIQADGNNWLFTRTAIKVAEDVGAGTQLWMTAELGATGTDGLFANDGSFDPATLSGYRLYMLVEDTGDINSLRYDATGSFADWFESTNLGTMFPGYFVLSLPGNTTYIPSSNRTYQFEINRGSGQTISALDFNFSAWDTTYDFSVLGEVTVDTTYPILEIRYGAGNANFIDYTLTSELITPAKAASGDPVFSVQATGDLKSTGRAVIGANELFDNNVSLDVHSGDRTIGLRVDNSSQAANKSSVDAVRLVSRTNADLHTNYSHLVAIEGSTTVFDLGKSALVVNKKVTLGSSLSTHNADVMIGGTSGLLLPKGTEAQRVTLAEEGTLRYNTDSNAVEVKAASGWEEVGGSFAPQTFNIANADWTSRGAAVDGIESFEYRIASSSHGLGADVFCQFKEKVTGTFLPGVVYRSAEYYYEVDSVGQIFILAEDVDRAALPTDVQVRVSL